jgi:hypothetical protein
LLKKGDGFRLVPLRPYIENPLNVFRSIEECRSVVIMLLLASRGELSRDEGNEADELSIALIEEMPTILQHPTYVLHMLGSGLLVRGVVYNPIVGLALEWAESQYTDLFVCLRAMVMAVSSLPQPVSYDEVVNPLSSYQVAMVFLALHGFDFVDKAIRKPADVLMDLYGESIYKPSIQSLLSDLHVITRLSGFTLAPGKERKVEGRTLVFTRGSLIFDLVWEQLMSAEAKIEEHPEIPRLTDLVSEHDKQLLAVSREAWSRIHTMRQLSSGFTGAGCYFRVEGALGEMHGSSCYLLVDGKTSPGVYVVRQLKSCVNPIGCFYTITELDPSRMESCWYNESILAQKRDIMLKFLVMVLYLIAYERMLTGHKEDGAPCGVPPILGVDDLYGLL